MCLDRYIYGQFFVVVLLNQARAGIWLARAWFLEIAFVLDVGMCVYVCVPAP